MCWYNSRSRGKQQHRGDPPGVGGVSKEVGGGVSEGFIGMQRGLEGSLLGGLHLLVLLGSLQAGLHHFQQLDEDVEDAA